eukprot:8287468-Pyramimonas_sp.AAC.1
MPVASFLSDLPPAKELFGKLSRGPAPPKRKVLPSGRAHRVLWNGCRWRCVQCARCFNDNRAPDRCTVLPPALKRLAEIPLDRPHKLHVCRVVET